MQEKGRRHVAYCVVTLGLLVLLAGCSREDIQAVGDLIPLQKQLITEYGVSTINVELQDGHTLGVTVVDDPSSSLAQGQKTERAREIASFVCESYASMDRIDQVWVAFEGHQDGSTVDTTGSVTFAFEKNELECHGGW